MQSADGAGQGAVVVGEDGLVVADENVGGDSFSVVAVGAGNEGAQVGGILGCLPVELAVLPSERADVILWPEREVELLAWDAWNSRGV